MPPIQILCGAADISGSVDWASVDCVSVVTKEKGSLAFSLLSPAIGEVPAIGETVYLKYLGALLFGGTCVELETVVDGGVLQRVKVTCADWGYQFDSKLVAKTYQDMDPADIVADIVANFTAGGFTTAQVQRANFQIASQKFNYEQPTKCLEALAKTIGWDWYIDPQKDVHFFFAATGSGSSEINPAPFDIEDGTGNVQFPSLDVDVSIANLKNSVYVIGGTMFRPNAASTTPDVYATVAGQTVYPIAYPYDATALGTTLKVTLDGVSQSIGIDGQDAPGTVNVLYNAGSGGGAQGGAPFIRFTSDPGGGHQLKVFGNASLPIVAHVTSPASILEYGEQQDVIVDKQIKSVLEAQARAEGELIQFDHPVYDVKFSTLTPGLSIGQTIKLKSARFGFASSPYQLLIRRVEAVGYSPTQLLFQVEALGSDNVTFTDMMATLLQESLAQNATPDNTVLQEILSADDALAVTDSVAATGASGPYAWGPASAPLRWNFAKWG